MPATRNRPQTVKRMFLNPNLPMKRRVQMLEQLVGHGGEESQALLEEILNEMIANKGSEFGVDVSHNIWVDGERAGSYFVEYGASPRPTRVIYDRRDSALAKIQPGMVKWEDVLRGARLFHVGGITPALSPSAAETQKEALRAARKARS